MSLEQQPTSLMKFKSFQDLSGYLNKKKQSNYVPSKRYSSYNKHKFNNPESCLLPSLNDSKIPQGVIFKPYRNSTLKLQSVSHTLNQIQRQLKALASQTKVCIFFKQQTIRYKQNLTIYLQQDLNHNCQESKQQISKLSKLIRTSKNINSMRLSEIYQDCGVLWQQNQKIKQKLFQIKIRTENIQKLMGAEIF